MLERYCVVRIKKFSNLINKVQYPVIFSHLSGNQFEQLVKNVGVDVIFTDTRLTSDCEHSLN